MIDSSASAIAAFAVTAALLTIAPGLDTALVLRTAASGGSRQGMSVALGISCGVVAWGTIVALGLGAILTTSPAAFGVLRWVGAAYLTYLGCVLIFSPRRELGVHLTAAVNADEVAPTRQTRAGFARGFLTNILNPKVGVFYLTFLPQFVPPHVNASLFMVGLAAIHAAEGIVWFSVLVSLTQTVIAWLRRPAVVTAMDRVTGALLVGFAMALILSRP